jgi:hypothetical protein
MLVHKCEAEFAHEQIWRLSWREVILNGGEAWLEFGVWYTLFLIVEDPAISAFSIPWVRRCLLEDTAT